MQFKASKPREAKSTNHNHWERHGGKKETKSETDSGKTVGNTVDFYKN